MYRIRRKKDGLFSTGGQDPKFTKTGKLWKQRGHLTSHLNLVRNTTYAGCEVVEYEVTEARTENVSEWQYAVQIRKEEVAARRKEQFQSTQRKRRLELYKELQKEFGDRT